MKPLPRKTSTETPMATIATKLFPTPPASRAGLPSRLFDAHEAIGGWLTKAVEPAFNLLARFWMARIFFDSGLIRIRTWEKQPDLFENIHPVPGVPGEIAALLTTG